MMTSQKNVAVLMSAWNTYFISENCGANIDFLFLKQLMVLWHFVLKYERSGIVGDQSYINGERNNGLSFFV